MEQPMTVVCGIYSIVCTPTGRQYIGSSRNIRRRWAEHLRELRSETHHCVALQAAFRKYGESAFRFRVVEITSKEVLLSREQQILDEEFTKTGRRLLNSSRGAMRPPSFHEWSEESQRRHREAAAKLARTMHSDPAFAERRDERMRKLNADPTFAAKNKARGAAMLAQWRATPEGKARQREIARSNGAKVMKRLHADPAFQVRRAERLSRLNADPGSRARCVAATREANSKQVRVTWDNGSQFIFASAAEVERLTGIGRTTITFRCREGAVSRSDGSRWEFA
jgi:group I intron endonuclease